MDINKFLKKIGISKKELLIIAKELNLDIKSATKKIDKDSEFLIAEYVRENQEVGLDLSDDKAFEDIDKQLDKEVIEDQKKIKMASKKTNIKKTYTQTNKTFVKDIIKIGDTISVKELSEKTKLPPAKIIQELFSNGIIATINKVLDFDTASIVCSAFNINITREKDIGLSEQALLEGDISAILKEDDISLLVKRPPIISVMGHVDHGKTKLLDYIRKTNVIDTEAGGITQKIGAYQITYKDEKITFIDTPGHEAFSQMRARGVKVTDIVILVVAADEGVKPQTKEAYNHAKEGGVPVIVAINKIDKPESNIEKTTKELADLGLVSEKWGGDTIIVPISSLTGEGVEDLLNMILLIAEMHELKANPERTAIATIIESYLDTKKGPIVNAIINTGTLQKTDYIVSGTSYGKIKALKNSDNLAIDSALPSTPIQILGFNLVPGVGEIIEVAKNINDARDYSLKMSELKKVNKIQKFQGLNSEQLSQKIKDGKIKKLKIVLKAETEGLLEAIKNVIEKIDSPIATPVLIHLGVGDMNESDVLMASASHAIIIGFNIKLSKKVAEVAEHQNVDVKLYSIIYELIEDIEKIINGMIEKEEVINDLGEGEVLKIFFSSKKEQVVGVDIKKGVVKKANGRLKIYRKDELVSDCPIMDLKRETKTVEEVKNGYNCGIKIPGGFKLEEGDKLYFYEKIWQ